MFLRLVCAFFLPPLAVFLTTGLSLAGSSRFCVSMV
ncbi:MAG: YqaE/Pmp3 family membrane protein [Microcystis aeruginosa BS11-05]|nr:YqaE/Pmp3 family membrane protein [Microcystis aeruginosa BS11-05]